MSNLNVISPNVQLKDNFIYSDYVYEKTIVERSQQDPAKFTLTNEKFNYKFKTDLKVPKVGLMLVGWGGNNGSTLTASIIANKKNLQWQTKRGLQSANYFGSLLFASTTKVGVDKNGEDVYIPFNQLLPMVNPNDLVISGWDINSFDLAAAMRRAQVLEPDLQRQVYEDMQKLKPLPSIYYKDFIAANQESRADNLIKAANKEEELEVLRNDIKKFKEDNQLDKVIVLWTANTERFADLIDGVNDTAENLLNAIKQNHSEISASSMFAIAAILESCPFINGSPQNTFVPGVIDLAHKHDIYIGGDDFKSGQTKLKSVLVDFLVGAGIKPLAITSYNHLGNNDGLNLNSHRQFRSKEISKTNVVDDMVDSNSILYQKGEKPDHVVIIKYVPAVGDSKRALDEYENEIFMCGRKTISIHNTCEDSLLASPLILDLAILTELMTRIQIKPENKGDYENFHPILSILSYMLKAPLSVDRPVNSLFKQRNAIENLLRICIGLPITNDLLIQKMTK
jgi:myo-inositol-1-phosphate synthase